MNNTQLVDLIYHKYNTELTEFIFKNLFYKQYTEDLLQEVYCNLMFVSNDILQSHYDNRTIIFYMKKIVLNMFNRKTSTYHKYIRIRNDNVNAELEDMEYDMEYDNKLTYVEDYNYELNFFDKLFRYYILGDSNGDKKTIGEISRDLKLSRYILKQEFNNTKKIITDNYGTK